MNPEERKLMMSMAKAIETQGQAILELKQERVTDSGTLNEGNIKSALAGAYRDAGFQPSGIESKISFEKQKQRLVMDVQFEGAEVLTFEERQKKCQQFLQEMQGLFEDYKVIRMQGSYAR